MGSNPNGISVSNGGSVAVQGNIYLQNTRHGFPGNATLTLNGTGTQLISSTVGIGASSLPIIVINKPSGILQLQGTINLNNSWTHTQGTIDANTFNSTVVLSNQNNTINGKAVFDNLRVQSSDNLGITINDTIMVKDTLLLSGTNINILNGKMIRAERHIINSNTAYNGGGTATIELTGSNNQTLAGLDSATVNAEGRGRLPRLTINKTAGTLTWRGVINIHGKLTWQQGFSQANTYSKVVLFETDSLIGNTAAASLTPTTGNMAFYELKYMTNNTRKLQAPLAINRRLILGGSLLKLNSKALNINTTDSTAIEATARLLADDTTSKVIWQIGNSTRTYTVPFVNSSLQAVSLQADITQAGIGNNGSLTFNTYRSNSQNLPYPESNENSFGFIDSNRLKIADRYWLLQHANFDSLPTLTVRTQYAAQDLASPNTINEDSLNSSVFSLPCWTKKTGTLNKAQKHYTATNIKQARVALALHDKSVVPVCNDGSSCERAYKLPDGYNDETVYLVNDTVKWLKFKALRTTEGFILFENPVTSNNYIKRVIVLSSNCSMNDTILDVSRNVNDALYYLSLESLTVNNNYLIKIISNSNNGYYLASPRACLLFTNVLECPGSVSECLSGVEDLSYYNYENECPPTNGLFFTPAVCPQPDGCYATPPQDCSLEYMYNYVGSNVDRCFRLLIEREDPINSGIYVVVFDQCYYDENPIVNVVLPPGNYRANFSLYAPDFQSNIIGASDYYFSVFESDPRPEIVISSAAPYCQNTCIPLDCNGCDILQLGNNSFTEIEWNISGPNNYTYNQSFTSSPFDINFCPTQPGVYTIRLTKTINIGQGFNIIECSSGFDEVQITVSPSLADFDYSISCNASNQFGVVFTDDSDCATSWFWNFDVSASPSSASPATFNGKTPPTVVYSTTGNKTVSLTINGNNNLKMTKIINLQYPAPPLGINGPVSACSSSGTYSIQNPQSGFTYDWTITGGTPATFTGTSTNITWTNPALGGSISVVTRDNSDDFNGCKSEPFVLNIEICCTAGTIVLGDMLISDFNDDYANNTGQYTSSAGIVFNGVLTINESFEFRNCPNIKFGPNARVEILNGNTLEYERCTLSIGCDNTMWDGVYIASTGRLNFYDSKISYAINAVVSNGGGRYDISRSEFDRNLRHVTVNAFSGTHTGNIWDTDFTCSANLIGPHSGKRSEYGIKATDVTNLFIGDLTQNTNNFSQMRTAIELNRTRATILNNNISNLLNTGLGGTTRGIWAYNTNNAGAADINIGAAHTTFANFISGAVEGINIERYNDVSILNNSISSGVSTGIRIRNSRQLNFDFPSFVIEDNTIAVALTGIRVDNNLADNIQRVNNNTIDLTSSNASAVRIGIIINRPLGNNNLNQLEINNNNIDGVFRGIVVNNKKLSQIVGNEIDITSGNNNGARNGIELKNSGGTGGSGSSAESLVQCNTVIGTNNTIQQRQKAIRVDANSYTRYKCNTLKNCGTAFEAQNGNVISVLQHNTFMDNHTGVAIRNFGNIGPQGFANSSTSFFNKWEANTGFTITNHLFSAVQTHFTSFTLKTPQNSNNPYYPSPLFSNVNNGTLIITTPVNANVGIACLGLCDIIPTEQNDSVQPSEAFILKIAGDSLAFPQDSLTHRWWNRYELYHYLKGNTALVQSYTLLQNFMSSYGNSSSALLDSVRKDLGEYMGSGSQNADSYNNFISRINNISSSHFIESVGKDYLKTLLKIYNGNDSTYLKNTVQNIANLCVFNAGPAVLEARSYVIADSIDLINRNWDDSCSTGNSYRLAYFEEETVKEIKKATVESKNKYFIIPNPLNGEQLAKIIIEPKQSGNLEIYNIAGQKVYTSSLNEGENMLNFIKLSNGVYMYRIFIGNKLNNTSKLIVVQE